jgi:hypothetical protein
VKLSERIIQVISAMQQQSPRHDLTQPTVLVRNLVWLYQVMTASENLMEVAFRLSQRPLRDYLGPHIDEEHDHAKWLAEDLASWGIDVTTLPLNRHAVELAGTQYYLIHHVSPNELLGYMAVLEGFPFPLEVLEQLEAIHGKTILRCLRYHAENDIEHRKELFRVIDMVGDECILENAVRTQYLIDEAFRANY